MTPPIQDHVVLLLVYAPVPLLSEALPYSQAARALANSELAKMLIPDRRHAAQKASIAAS
jgi:hypothetical protein